MPSRRTLTDAELADLLDFHDGVALAADYPTLLRALGLVVDLEIAWPTGLPASGMVSVKVGSLAGAYSYPLRTHYTLAGGRFLPAPRPVNEGQPETNAGLLRLSDENRYRVVQTDVVGAVIKVQNTATAIVAQGVSGLQTLPAADRRNAAGAAQRGPCRSSSAIWLSSYPPPTCKRWG